MADTSPLGVQTLYSSKEAIVDIIAVHGLGADPNWAWVSKTGRKDAEGNEVLVNWLSDPDMLPSQVPESRITTFNYESWWCLGTLKQRRPLCSLQLLDTIKNLRDEEPIAVDRPIIFIGHSFGGIVIEQALVIAASDDQYKNIISSTVGVVFLGTPHRGSGAQKWGLRIAKAARALGFHTDDSILKDLEQDSETLIDLLDHFVRLVNKHHIEVICFFEQHETNYGIRRYGIPAWIKITEMVADEASATIPGYAKLPLPTDHLKINKYDGPSNASYRSVYPRLKAIVRNCQALFSRNMAMSLLEENKSEERRLAQPQVLAPLGDPDDIKRLKAQYLRTLEHMDVVSDALKYYIRAEAISHPGFQDRFDLADRVEAFLQTADQRVFLILGSAGAGKSTFNHSLARQLWKKFDLDPLNAAIPLYISLASLNLEDSQNDLIGGYFKDRQFSEQQIGSLQRHRQFVFILDGYDEIKYRNGNFYEQNKLGSWNAKVIIASRPEYLGSNYECKFYPPQQPRLLEQCWLTPLSYESILDYIRRYVQANPEGWTVEQYTELIHRPDLNSLLANPFLLAITMTTAPKLLAAKKFSRLSLYETFVKTWLDRAEKRLHTIQLTQAEAFAFHHLWENQQFTLNCLQYCKQFALSLYRKHVVEVTYNVTFPLDPDWSPLFQDDRPDVRLFRFNSPLIRQGNTYRFIHKSIRDFLVAQTIVEDLTTESAFRMEKHVREKGKDDRQNSLINEFHLVSDPAVLDFIVECVRSQPSLKPLLLGRVKLSVKSKKYQRAAANAITILVRAGHIFFRSNLSYIRIPGADLSFGIFHNTKFRSADLTDVNFRGAWLKYADFTAAVMSGVQFGERGKVQVHSGDVAFSPDGKILASYSGNKVRLLSVEGQLLRTIVSFTGHIECVVFSSNGKLASCSGNIICLWSMDGQLLRILNGHMDPVKCMAFSPDGKIFTSWSSTAAHMWLIDDRILNYDIGRVNRVVFSPDGKTFASCGGDSTVRLWSLEGQLLETLQGHTGWVSRVEFSPDGKRLASCGGDNNVCLWSLKGQLLETFQGHTGWVYSVVFSPDGKRLASCSDDKTVRLWSLEGQPVETLQAHTDWVSSVEFSPDGQYLTSCGGDNTVRLWSLEGQLLETLQGHTGWVNSVVFSPDGKRLASCSDDKTVRLWSLEGQLLETLQGHTGWVKCVVFSPDGKTLASCSDDKTVRLWSLKGQLVKTLQGHTDWVNSITFSPDGKRLASCSYDKTVRLWSLKGHLLETLQGHTDWVNSVVFSTDGKRLVSCSDDKTVRLWSLKGPPLEALHHHICKVKSIAFSPDGKTLASCGGDKTVCLWSLEGKLLETLHGHMDQVNNVVFSSDEKAIASCSNDKTVRLWSVNGQLQQILVGHTHFVQSVVFSPDSKMLASCSDDRTVCLWSIEGQLLRTLEAHTACVRNVAFLAAGETLASYSGDGIIRLWSIAGLEQEFVRLSDGYTGGLENCVFSPPSQTLYSLGEDESYKAIRLWSTKGSRLVLKLNGDAQAHSRLFLSPDHTTVASCSENMVYLWAATGNSGLFLPTQRLSHHTDRICSIAFSQDSKTLASGSQDKTVCLWSTDGRLLRILENHTRFTNIGFSIDGNVLALCNYDGRIRLWSVKSGELLNRLNGHTNKVLNVVFSPDKNSLASYALDNKICLWSIDGHLLRTFEYGIMSSGDQFLPIFNPTGRATSISITNIVFSPDGNILASCSFDQTIWLWSVKSGQLLKILSGHTGTVLNAFFSPDGHYLASYASDNTVRLWSIESGQLLETFEGFEAPVRQSRNIESILVAFSQSSDKSPALYICDKSGNFFVFNNPSGGHNGYQLSAIWRATQSLEADGMLIDAVKGLSAGYENLLLQKGAMRIRSRIVNIVDGILGNMFGTIA